MGLEPILDFSGPDSGVVWNVLYNLIQPIFPVPVPVPCSSPGVSQCEYTIRVEAESMTPLPPPSPASATGFDNYVKILFPFADTGAISWVQNF